MEPETPLGLAERSGLPDRLAHLRAVHPKDDWRGHVNFGEFAGFWLHIHDALRAEARGVVDLAARLRDRQIDRDAFSRAFVPRFNGFLQHLDQHHRVEDALYFPKFRLLDDRMVAGFDLLESDHQLIHTRLVESVDNARTLLAALGTRGADANRAVAAFTDRADQLSNLLGRHLADEEELVVPALLEHGERSVM